MRKIARSSPSTMQCLPLTPSNLAAQDVAEARAFSYFLTCVAPSLAGPLDREFWTVIVPKISQSDPAVRHAVLAISDLYEHPPRHAWATTNVGDPLDISEMQSFRALTWYNRSLSRFQNHLSSLQDSEKAQLALLSCVLFTSLEFQQNNVQNALRLLGRGYDVFALATEPLKPGNRLPTSLIDEVLMPMFSRHVILMACFGHHPPPQWSRRFHQISQLELGPMKALSDARSQLFNQTCKALAFVHASGTLIGSKKEGPMENLKAQQELVLHQLHQWRRDFELLLADLGMSFTGTQRTAVSMLFMYFQVSEIWTLSCLHPTPMIFDDYLERFEFILQHAEQILDHSCPSTPPPFSFEMGVIPPLHFTGWKCHHPLHRRRALALIRQAPAQEALFSADLNYRATAKIIEIEEGPNHLPLDLVQFEACIKTGAKIILPKEEDRVNGVVTQYENQYGQKVAPRLIYTKGRFQPIHGWNQISYSVPI